GRRRVARGPGVRLAALVAAGEPGDREQRDPDRAKVTSNRSRQGILLVGARAWHAAGRSRSSSCAPRSAAVTLASVGDDPADEAPKIDREAILSRGHGWREVSPPACGRGRGRAWRKRIPRAVTPRTVTLWMQVL